MKKYIEIIIPLSIILMCCSMSKREFLDAKPSTNVLVPTTLSELQGILDDVDKFGESGGLSIVSCEDIAVTDDALNSLEAVDRNAYTWKSDVFEGYLYSVGWSYPYTAIFYANTVIDGVAKLDASLRNSQAARNLLGMAYFYRGYAFYKLAQHYCLPYDPSSAGTNLGLPLRLSTNINVISKRSTLQETYNQIDSDYSKSLELLIDKYPSRNENRPSRCAAYAAMARFCLTKREYQKAGAYADSSLSIYNTLFDYNQFPEGFDGYRAYEGELLLMTFTNESGLLASLAWGQSDDVNVDTAFFNLYSANDLRKTVRFVQLPGGVIKLRANGSYNNNGTVFTGLAVDEVYLIRAECNARNGLYKMAEKDINTLLVNRFQTGTYQPTEFHNAKEALEFILLERRKELAFRDLKWEDLRRLNLEGYNISLHRKVNNETFTLVPNSVKYALPIPPDEIIYSKIEQNKR